MDKIEYTEELDAVNEERDGEELDINNECDGARDGDDVSASRQTEAESDASADSADADDSREDKSEDGESTDEEGSAPVKSFACALGFAIASGAFIILNIFFICFSFKASSDLSVAFSMLIEGGENAVMAGVSMATSVMLLLAYGICSLIISIIVLVLARYSRKHAEGALSVVSLCEMIASGVLALFPIIVAISAIVSIAGAFA